jgi:hypothetical protein
MIHSAIVTGLVSPINGLVHHVLHQERADQLVRLTQSLLEIRVGLLLNRLGVLKFLDEFHL